MISQRLPLFSALHEVVASVELIELDVVLALFDAETPERFCELVASADVLDSTELVTLLEVAEFTDMFMSAE